MLFRRLRQTGEGIVAIMASFGASLALRSLLEAIFTSRPAYFTRALQIAKPLGFGLRITPNQSATIAATALLVAGTHLFLTRTRMGRAMRAVAENPGLARVNGIDVEGVIRVTWMLGGALAAASGIVVGLSQAAAVAFVGAQWRGAVAFVILIAVLLVRPSGLFGASQR